MNADLQRYVTLYLIGTSVLVALFVLGIIVFDVPLWSLIGAVIAEQVLAFALVAWWVFGRHRGH